MVMSKPAKRSKWKPECPEAEARALFTPNQTMRMIASPRNKFVPSVSNIAACVVIRFDKNAKRSFIVSGGMARLPLRLGLGHAVGEHAGARVARLGAQDGLFFGHETDVAIDGCCFRVALAL